jgi:hypothetical protein
MRSAKNSTFRRLAGNIKKTLIHMITLQEITKHRYASPHAEIVTASASLVDRLLSMNTDNRIIRTSVVDAYASEIKINRWVLTNQGIGVSDSGVLIDGQHRLLALKKCGYPPVKLLIVYGLTKEARLAVDQHSKRSARDLLQFAFNAKVARSAPAIARLIDRERMAWTGGATPIGRIIDILQEYKEEIELVVSWPSFEHHFAAPILTGAVKVMYEYPERRGDIMAFLDKVRLGEMLSRDEPAYCLRNYISNTRYGGAVDQKEGLAKTVRAIIAEINGKKMKTLRA